MKKLFLNKNMFLEQQSIEKKEIMKKNNKIAHLFYPGASLQFQLNRIQNEIIPNKNENTILVGINHCPEQILNYIDYYFCQDLYDEKIINTIYQISCKKIFPYRIWKTNKMNTIDYINKYNIKNYEICFKNLGHFDTGTFALIFTKQMNIDKIYVYGLDIGALNKNYYYYFDKMFDEKERIKYSPNNPMEFQITCGHIHKSIHPYGNPIHRLRRRLKFYTFFNRKNPEIVINRNICDTLKKIFIFEKWHDFDFKINHE